MALGSTTRSLARQCGVIGAIFLFSLIAADAAEKQPINFTGAEESGAPTANRSAAPASLTDMLKVRGDSSGAALLPAVPPLTIVNPTKQTTKDDKWSILNGSTANSQKAVDAGFGVRDYSADTILRADSKGPIQSRNSSSGSLGSSFSAENRGAQEGAGDTLSRSTLGSQRSSISPVGSSAASRLEDIRKDGTRNSDGTKPPEGISQIGFHGDLQDRSKAGFGFANPFTAGATGAKTAGAPSAGFNQGAALDLVVGIAVPIGQGFNNSSLLQPDPTRREINPLTGSTRNDLNSFLQPPGSPPPQQGVGFAGPGGAPAFGAAVDFFTPTVNSPAKSLSSSSGTAVSSAPPIAAQPAVLPIPTRTFR